MTKDQLAEYKFDYDKQAYFHRESGVTLDEDEHNFPCDADGAPALFVSMDCYYENYRCTRCDKLVKVN